MSEQIERGSNDRNKTMALKKSIFTNTSLPASERLTAGHHYLSIALINKDNVPPVNKLIKEFQDDPNPEIRKRALRLKKRVMRLRDLKKIASVPLGDDADDEPIADVEPSTSPAATETQSETAFASTVLAPNVEFGYPPEDVIFPPPAEVPYRLGEIDFTNLAVRLRGLPAPAPNAHEASESIIRAALGLTAWVPIELPLLQKLLYALRYEPKALDPTMPASQWSRYWPYAKLFAAVWYLGNVKHPYGSLRDAPLAPPTGARAKSVFWQREYEYHQRENQHV
jgi:hypothetical protein